MSQTAVKTPSERKAYIIAGPTSGIGRVTSLELAKHGTVVLVGRDRAKLEEMRKIIEQKGQHALSVVCDLAEPASVHRAAAEIVSLHRPIAGLLNNAGIMQMCATKNPLGWDMSFATNHLGPFALTEALMPSLSNGANVVIVVSAVEDPGRKPAVAVGFRGGRYIQQRRVLGANGNQAVPNGRASMLTRLPNEPSLLRRWCSPVRLHGCTSTRSSRA
jgi:NAD(P)-dependent dehydrogenase (short-subunit alcohol dehydrogenase family)